MKKLCTLLLSVMMAASLAVPAFAAPDAPAAEAVPISGILEEAGSLGIIGGADGPTAIITTGSFGGQDWMNIMPRLDGMDSQEYQAALNELKEALGGVPGQIGVMVNGAYVKFPDAVPEVAGGRTMVPVRALVETLGGEVDYQDGAVQFVIDGFKYGFTTGAATVSVSPTADNGKDTPKPEDIEMDCAPYVKDGRTYVPIRFISEALGYEVGWDSEFQTAILLDREALAAEIDKNFTILNRVQANGSPAIGDGKSSLTDAKCSLTVTAFDTVNGNKTYKADMTGKTLMNDQAINGTYSFTVSDNALDDLEELLTSVYGAEFEENALLVRTVVTGLKDMEVIMTADGMVYAHAPILDELSGKKNVWGSMNMGAELGTLLAAQLDADTMGSAIASMVRTDSVANWAGMSQMMDMMDSIYGDDKFTTANGVSTFTFGLDELIALCGDMGLPMDEASIDEVKDVFKEYRITMKVDEKGGATAASTMEIKAQAGVPAIKITMDSTQSAGKADMTMTVHVANIGELELTATSTEKTSSDAPKTEPPKDATIIEADSPELLNP